MEAFSLDESSGALSKISGSPFGLNSSMGLDMAVSTNNSSIYLLSQQFNPGDEFGPTSLLAYSIDPSTGTPQLKQTLATGSQLSIGLVTVHPSGKFVYLAPYSNNSPAGIGVFSVASDGTLALSEVSSNLQADDGIAITPNGQFAYAHSDGDPIGDWGNNPCGPVESYLWEYSIDSSTGALTPIAGGPLTFQRQVCYTGPAATAILKQVDPSGSRLFTVDLANYNVQAYSIDPTTGALTALPGSSSGNVFSSEIFDAKGQFLYVGQVDAFTGYSASSSSASGNLTKLPGMPVPVNGQYTTGSTTMAIDPSSTYLFSNENEYTSAFSCCGPDGFLEFKINQSTGTLTPMQVTPSQLVGAASKIVVVAPQ